MEEKVLLQLQVVLQLLVPLLGFAAFYFYWRPSNQSRQDRSTSEDVSGGGKKRRETTDRGTNTDATINGSATESTSDDQRSAPKIPIGVQLRNRRGRATAQDKLKRNAQIWSDSGYESFPVSAAAIPEPPRTECIANTIKQMIGESGGTLALSGCLVVIPPNALTSEHEIELSCVFDNPAPKDSRFLDMTPTLDLKPRGLKFQRPVAVVLPSYYDAADSEELIDITIQMKQDDSDDWEECEIVKNNLSKKILFHVNHFTKFRGIIERIQCRFLKKQLYYAAFVKRYRLEEVPKVHVLVWCLCDNLPYTVQQITTEMREHYERVVESETLEIRYGQDINLELSCPSQIGAMPSTHVFDNGDLWPHGMMRKRLFHLHRPKNADIDLVGIDFKMKIKAAEDDSFSLTREGVGSFHWAQPLSAPDHDYANIIKDSLVSINVHHT